MALVTKPRQPPCPNNERNTTGTSTLSSFRKKVLPSMEQRITRITTTRIPITRFYDALMSQWRIKSGSGGCLNPPPHPVFKYPMKMNIL